MRSRPLPVAAAVLGAVFASERLAAAPTTEETRKGPAANERRLNADDISTGNLIVRKAKRPASIKGQAGYEYQDWFDWKPKAVEPAKRGRSVPTTPASRPPTRSDY